MKPFLKLLLCTTIVVLAVLSGAVTASAWAPEASATIHPGVMTFTNAQSFLGGASQCTSNFVYTDASGSVYLGQAAHCSSTGESTETTAVRQNPFLSERRSTRVNSSTAESRTERSSERSPTTRGSPCSPNTKPIRTPAPTTTSR